MQTTTRFATLALAIAAAAAPAAAQSFVSGNTLGCFGAGCTPTSSTANFAIDATGAAIAFAGTSFSGETNPVTGGFTVGSFGTFTLTGLSATTPNTTFSTPFTLLFQLTSPTGATNASTTFAINGFVGNVGGQGARDISYTGGTTTFTFTGGRGTILTDGGQIGPNTTTISGRVTATASSVVPEPSTYALLATGFVGLAGAVVRRRNASV